MKTKLFTLLAALAIAAGAAAQTTIATMKTTAETVSISVVWTGDGTITANGVLLVNNSETSSDAITPTAGGVVTLIATGGARLTYLDCGNNSLTELDVTNCTELTNLNCYNNSLTALDVTNCQKLEVLDCGNNSLTELDVTNCPELTVLSCSNNSLTELDVTNCTQLTYLECFYNSLTTLDVSNCTKLSYLYANNQQIEMEVLPGAGEFVNPILYKNQTETEPIIIDGMEYAQGSLVTIPANGEVNFTITRSIADGEPFSGIITIKRINVIAVDEVESETSLSVYSTPNGIAVSGIPAGETIAVYNNSGMQVAVAPAQEGATIIPLSAQGLYIVKAGTQTAKVVK